MFNSLNKILRGTSSPLHRPPCTDIPSPGEKWLYRIPQRGLPTGAQSAGSSLGEQRHHQAGSRHADGCGGPPSALPHRKRHRSRVPQGTGSGRRPRHTPPGSKQTERGAHGRLEQTGKPQRLEAVWESDPLDRS